MTSALIPFHRQAIITSFRFDCYGNITEWRLATRAHSTITSLQFQVWRPSPLVETNGCYSLVGSNKFTAVPQNHSVVVVSPLPEDRVEFAPGDVLGFCVKGGRRNDAGLGVVALRDFGQRGDKGYATEEVWYGTVADIIINPDPNCLFSVGPNGHLNTLENAAPVLSVSFGKHHCLYTILIQISCAPTDESQPLHTDADFVSMHSLGNTSFQSIILITGTMTTAITVIIVTLFIVTAIAIKRGKCCRKDASRSTMATNNEAHEMTLQDTTNDPVYDSPMVFDIKENVAYATITKKST